MCYNYIVMTKFNLCSSAVIYKRWQIYDTPATTAGEVLFVEKIPWAVLHLIFLSWPWFRCQFIFSGNIIVSTGHIFIFLTFHFDLPKHYQWTLELHQKNKYQGDTIKRRRRRDWFYLTRGKSSRILHTILHLFQCPL